MDVWYNGDYGVSFYEYGTELEPFGKFLGHTWKNWSLIPTVRPFVVPPTPKGSKENDSLYTNGNRNSYNDLLGFPLFNNREGSWTFYIASLNDYSEYIEDSNSINPDQFDDWYVRDNTADVQSPNMTPPMHDVLLSTTKQDFQNKYSQLLRMLHAKELVIVLDEDQEHFYRGTVQIEEFVASNDGSLNGLKIKYSLFPYKMERDNTIIDIPVNEINYETPHEISFSVGTMPAIPLLRIKKKTTAVRQLQIGFYNLEIDGVSTDIPSGTSGTDYNVECPSTDSSSEDINVYLTASYSNKSGMISRPTFLCSSNNLNNACHLQIRYPKRHQSTDAGGFLQELKVLYRKGYL